jgi:hypothetical protein
VMLLHCLTLRRRTWSAHSDAALRLPLNGRAVTGLREARPKSLSARHPSLLRPANSAPAYRRPPAGT